MTTCKQGDVVLIPFPFTDLTTTKHRPAVIISSNDFNARGDDVIIFAITSHIPSRLSEDDYLLKEEERKAAGLPKASLVKAGKIVTIDQRLIRKVIGHLPNKTVEQLKANLSRCL